MTTALVLWNPDRIETAPFDDALSQEANRLRWRNADALPTGPMREHYRRAELIAMVTDDACYACVERMDAKFYIRSGPKKKSRYDGLRHAHDVAKPDYFYLRDVLAGDHNIPYTVACVVAGQYTYHFTRKPKHLL